MSQFPEQKSRIRAQSLQKPKWALAGVANGDAKKAVREALGMALKGKRDRTHDFVIVFATSGSETQQILLQLREMLGDRTKIGNEGKRCLHIRQITMTEKRWYLGDPNPS